MRWLFLVLLVACEHRPPSKQTPTTKGETAAVPTTTPDAGSVGSAQQVPTPDDACTQIGARVAEIIISATTDPTQKAAYEQERTKLVKRFAENCAREQWPESTRTCFFAAKTATDLEACSRQIPRPAPPAGSAAPPGSAAPAVPKN